MAWVFVRLKWRLLVNARSSPREQALAWIARVAGIAASVQAALALAAAPRHGGAGLVAAFVTLTVAWVMLPLLYGSDQSLDPLRLALLPLRRRDVVQGLFAASWVGAPPVATAILVAGAVAGFWTGGAGGLLVVADGVVITVLVIATGRMVSAALAAVLHSRRGRDTASLVLAVVSAGGYIAWRLASSAAARLNTIHPSTTTGALGWTPPGALAQSMADASSGRYAAAAVRLAYGMAAVAVVGWLWALAVERRLTTPVGTQSSARRRQGRDHVAVQVGRTPAAAVLWKDLRYMWRAPAQRASVVTGFLAAGFVSLPALTGSHRPDALLAYVGAMMALFISANLAGNLFGIDREAFSTYVLAGTDPADLVRGKRRVVATVVGAVGGAATIVAGLVGHSAGQIPSALLVVAATTAIGVGGGVVLSVLSPFPVAIDAPAFGRARRPRGRGSPGLGLLMFALEVCATALAAGLVLGSYLLGLGTLPGALAAAALSGIAWYLGSRFAIRRLRERMPETLAALSPRG
ncbi:MAG: hypothetical protein ACTHNU_14820 [Gaiellales bacterium]